MANLTECFVAYLLRRTAEIRGDILDRAAACYQDYLAVAAAGARKNCARWAPLCAALPSGPAALIGYPETVDPLSAALINGFNAHALELDDGQRFAMIHLGACVISALEAAGAIWPIAREKFLAGIVIGYEAACRASIAMQPSHKKKGYHTSGTCGTIGAAAGVAAALEMDARQLKRVLSLAAGSAAGMLELQEQNSEVKPYNLGRAAMDGLAAARMGLADFEVPDDVLGGERGFFRTFSEDYDPQKLTEETDCYEIERIYVKPYASCRHSHSAVEAAIRLSGKIDPKKIDRVLVETYRLGVKGHDHTEITGTASAKLSTPYAVAAALLYGRADLRVFEPPDAAAIALAAKVHVAEDEALSAESPRKRIAVVTVYQTDGVQESCRVDYAKGDPENPMTDAERKQKIEMLNAFSNE